MDINEHKQLLREQVRAARAAIPQREREAAEEALTKRLLSLPAVKNAKTVGAYFSFGSEIPLKSLVTALRAAEESHTIALPVVVSPEAMVFLRVDIDDDLEIFSNPAATIADYDRSKAIPAKQLDMLFVPGLAFDAKCGRLGQGRGYYDRYLPLLREDCLSVGIAFDEQIVDEVPMSPQDKRVDYVVTPSQIFAS